MEFYKVEPDLVSVFALSANSQSKVLEPRKKGLSCPDRTPPRLNQHIVPIPLSRLSWGP
jgi:hypothetical protein